jgi:hypothetical protein
MYFGALDAVTELPQDDAEDLFDFSRALAEYVFGSASSCFTGLHTCCAVLLSIARRLVNGQVQQLLE